MFESGYSSLKQKQRGNAGRVLYSFAPSVNDDLMGTAGNGKFKKGDEWFDLSTGIIYHCKVNTHGAAVWSFASPALPASSSSQDLLVDLTNRSAITLLPGHVVILDIANSLSIKTTVFQFDPQVVGIIKQGGAVGAIVKVQLSGIADVLIDGNFATVIGDYLYTSGTVLGYCRSTNGPFPGWIGRALQSFPVGSPGIIKVLLAGGLPEQM